ncbi:sulfurtransferase [Faunimonas sp. B44]|uniref:sulfurtransferase n=1 Tax=Faunimonas sp. B44 TaxID=3461493 RepID=UPI004044AF7C
MTRFVLRLAAAAASTLYAAIALAAQPLVSPEWLKGRLGSDEVVIVEFRTALGESSRDEYLTAHIPGAIWSDYPGAWRTDRDGYRGTVPSVEKLEAYLSELGVADGKTVVLVPVGAGSSDFGVAARAYWTLKYLGHDDVAILEGGWKAWQAAGLPTESGDVTPTGDLFVAEIRDAYRIETPDVSAEIEGDAILVDARPEEQYRGRDKSGEASRFGRLPGAMSLDQNLFFDEKGSRLKALPALKASVPASLAPDAEIVSYCNTGHWAATNWFVLHELLGYENVRLYVESMVGWTLDPSRPVESDRTRLDDLKAWWNGLFS